MGYKVSGDPLARSSARARERYDPGERLTFMPGDLLLRPVLVLWMLSLGGGHPGSIASEVPGGRSSSRTSSCQSNGRIARK